MALYNAELTNSSSSGLGIYYKELWKLYSQQKYQSSPSPEPVWLKMCALFKEQYPPVNICTIPDTLKNLPNSGIDSLFEMILDKSTAEKMYPLLQSWCSKKF